MECRGKLGDERDEDPGANQQRDRRGGDQGLMQLGVNGAVGIVMSGSRRILPAALDIFAGMLGVMDILHRPGPQREKPRDGKNDERPFHCR